MNKYTIKAFGITKEILGGKEAVVEVAGSSVADLKKELYEKYPRLNGLRSMFVAVNNEYAEDEQNLTSSDEIALIPPVSGG
jgi:molybdopterin synthase sulfur carrier subunit